MEYKIKQITSVSEVKDIHNITDSVLSVDFSVYKPQTVKTYRTNIFSLASLQKSFLADNNVIYGAYLKQKLVGFIWLKTDCGGVLMADWLAVKTEHRNQGIASKLLQQAEEWALSHHYHYLYLYTETNNNKAFYTKRGFKHIGTHPNFWFGETEYIFGKSLQKTPSNAIFKTKTNKKVITICSSASHYRQALKIQKQLQKMGFTVHVPSTALIMEKTGNFNTKNYKTWYQNSADYSKKTKLMQDHINLIKNSNAVLITNFTKNGLKGYIGGNVLIEMAFAWHYQIPLYVYNNISEDMPLKEEIYAFQAKFINTNLSQIQI